MRNPRPTTLIASLVSCMAMVLASCSSGSGASSTDTTTTEKTSDKLIRAIDTEPLTNLVPQNANDTAALKVVENVFDGLINFDEAGISHPAAAASIDASDNNTTFTIHLKPGQKFSDGSPVKAENFTRAWSYANEHDLTNAHYYEHFAGYKVSKPLPETGLKVIDDTTFVIHLDKPQVDFPVQLGHPAFYPWPDAAFKDVEAFGQKPVGNGPYKVDSWVHKTEIIITPNTYYTGPRAPHNAGVHFQFYPSPQSAYTALLSGQVDVVDDIPPSAFATYKKDLDGRFSNKAAAVLESLHIPERIPHFGGEEGRLRRAALSEAIDRKTIVDKLFKGTRTPATDFSSPVVWGHGEKLTGSEVLSYNGENARKLWEKANAISPFTGVITLAYNADGGHEAWINAVSNSLKNTLGVEVKPDPYPVFRALRSAVTDKKVTGPYRGGWASGFPSVLSFIGARYAAGDATEVEWTNPEYDKQLEAAATAATPEEAKKHYDAAQEVMLKDLPSIPLWNRNAVTGWSPAVKNVVVDWHAYPVYYKITRSN